MVLHVLFALVHVKTSLPDQSLKVADLFRSFPSSGGPSVVHIAKGPEKIYGFELDMMNSLLRGFRM